MKILLTLKVSVITTTVEVDLNEEGISKEEWESMSSEEKGNLMSEYCEAENEANRPFFEVEKFKEL